MALQIGLDEDVSNHLAGPLRANGHDVNTAQQLGHLALTHVKVLTRMADLNRILVSHNKRDMLLLHEAWLTWRTRWQATSHFLANILLVPHEPVSDLVRIIEEFAGFGIDPASRAFSWTAPTGWYEPFP
jgi:hypothetical protein